MGNTDELASGLLFLITLDFLKTKNPEAINDLQLPSGSIFYDKYHMYPLEDLNRLQKEVLLKVLGKVDEEGYYQLGKFTFEAYSHTLVGATLTNVSISQEDVLKNILDLWNTVVNFGTRTLIEVSKDQHYAVIEIGNDPRDSAYLQGVVETGIQSIGGKNVTSEIFGQGKDPYQIKIHWTN